MLSRIFLTVMSALLVFLGSARAQSPPELTLIEPAFPVTQEVRQLILIAQGELGYKEQDGVTKYGTWAGNPQAQWCAEFLCWVVDQVDQQHGSKLLDSSFPFYSSTNTGRDWFLSQGRYIARNGFVTSWGTQWYKGAKESMDKNSYIPQPGDWVFFSYTASGDTAHVAMVENCYRGADGQVIVQVIEGNNPDAVARAQYKLTDWRIQGYGTVQDLADIVLRMGAQGEKVKALQRTLADITLLGENDITGIYNQRTSDAVKAFQYEMGMQTTGIANQPTQLRLQDYYVQYKARHPEFWTVDPAR
jgi:hypothetical protein